MNKAQTRESQSEQGSLTYFSLKGTVTQTDYALVWDQERLENGHIKINYDCCFGTKTHTNVISGAQKIRRKVLLPSYGLRDGDE